MTYPFDQQLLKAVIQIAEGAGEKIMEVYQDMDQVEVTSKADDSPLTQADLAAHRYICDELAKISDFPILSEESSGITAEERLGWETYWLVDPLDGTKEFIAKNGEFTVNIALIHKQQSILGVVYVPAQEVCYYGAKGEGAFKSDKGEIKQIKTRSFEKSIEAGKLELVGSRRHGSEALEQLVSDLKESLCDVELVSQGSSLKFCVLAEGRADLYPRLALTCEWDTAAAQAVLEEAGGVVLTPELEPMRYNAKEELLNPFFWAIADETDKWKELLKGRIK